ncbi:bifunctional phosphopantothenoylcysteine decarboxylase/phosphopantothenate--cysteine ligase CoaBC [Sporanaerobium hydrogeniformans]|uniref:Bifunctional phosphopantothenoylcysteine decarboxylase/phosphopantothenate--cysteine ligase CoaBC n=1 Tax=Sporanaerobium hydrogeniformans TaxID=3072179 RepID=A0AC61DGF9_9FIRM|nr:bifunctional phosphopantothenoylcysteine decarboxylase/phosphopantothenate--cysteine ligase CoaBC [Sporanaerobium hydrogeniformans]PHV72286.1 bifunctional phosphopantothenoylcysteine decarboxylase/phosphopantothenate--cysteine ligase CoaBC [Sporanaerobium hydrogeniformans]
MKKTIVVGITGGIAAYKALDVVSGLRKKGFNVIVIMTKNACEFVRPLTFQSISQNYVVVDTFENPKSWDVEHIALAKKADLFLVVPATANIIGKVAHGIADDMLSTTIMATKAPVVFSPAMNTNMFENPIVQDNIAALQKRGYLFIEPATGYLACGDTGKGKLPAPEVIVAYVEAFMNQKQKQDLVGKHILVTAGPTVEALDPMRYLTNHSSGKMGYAIAEVAARRGAKVTLISGPTQLACPIGVKRIAIQSAKEMYEAVLEAFETSDIVIKAAAVADYRPATLNTHKIKKTGDDLTLTLVRNPDILKALGQNKGGRILVGFAAETQNIEEYAKQKIKNKNLDFIVANSLITEGAGFGGDTNIATIIDRLGEVEHLEKMSKTALAQHILDKVVTFLK